MTECQFCKENLVTDGLNAGQQLRCANCQGIMRFGDAEKIATDRLAWRSFWLGLASFVFLFFTGIPAVYYGVRSLLRMRFVKPKRSDQAAAVLGTTMGGCFGIAVGALLTTIGIVSLAVAFTRWDSSDERAILAQLPKHFQFELPPDVRPLMGRSVLNSQYEYSFGDQRDGSKRHFRIVLAYIPKSLSSNRNQLLATLSNRQLNGTEKGQRERLELLDWKLAGQTIKVRKTVFRLSTEAPEVAAVATEGGPPSPEAAAADDRPAILPDVVAGAVPEEAGLVTHQYVGAVSDKNGYYGVTILLHPDFVSVTEDDVKAIFAGIQVGDPNYQVPELLEQGAQSESTQTGG